MTESNGDLIGGLNENPNSESIIRSHDFNSGGRSETKAMLKFSSWVVRPWKIGRLVGFGIKQFLAEEGGYSLNTAWATARPANSISWSMENPIDDISSLSSSAAFAASMVRKDIGDDIFGPESIPKKAGPQHGRQKSSS
ncbi:hypothetical protein OGAPHI_002469 [Ogataea philodendri]|uniref:Uncharacterized protein n=1 Tax=Ogataea philodendri TaxID=1378263 RepID=A0A9P8PBL9_9ASCO|nr:uncharacterized protein OGAPHI_002469 [Ogataea philodendri]KAH3668715.1 hypothetical protein OGAPHI_002469 [Ogataea philodendri]